MIESHNILILQEVAHAFGDMVQEVVFVGATVVELYATDPAAPPVRPTVDVDCLVEITSRAQYRQLEEKLEKRGFRHDTSDKALLCRWRYGELVVDVMTTDQSVLGFVNQWHAVGIKQTVQYKIGDQLHVALLSPPFFVASKLEALTNRGGNDRRGKPDFEDTIFIVDNRPELPSEIIGSPRQVRGFLTTQFKRFLGDPMIREDVVSVMPTYTGEDRIEQVLARMKEIGNAIG